MKISVIIVTYNSEAAIKNCLSSVFSSSAETEAIIVDNNSGDKTIGLVEQFPKARLIRNKRNLGFGRANNVAARAASGDFLFFLNPDCVVEDTTIGKLANYLEKNKDVAVVGPKLLNSNGSIQREIANFPNFLSQIFILLRLHRIGVFQNFVYRELDYDKTQESEHLMGAALLVRREVFENVGGFDENFFLWFEETDLLKRIKDLGYRIVYYPEARVTHLVGQSTRQLDFFEKQTIWNKSLLYYFKKRKDWITILLLLPFIVLSYPAALISYLIKK